MTLLNQFRRAFRGPRGWRRDGGAELVEFALILPVLVVILVGIAEFGMLFQRQLTVTGAAREGARMAALPLYSAADVQTRVNAYLTAGGITPTSTPVVTPSTITGPSGATIPIVTVTVTYTYASGILGNVVSLIGGSFGPLTLRGVASMRLEVPTT
jgi:Flp pilus assembly protein TadG